jgi:hypothetical protein
LILQGNVWWQAEGVMVNARSANIFKGVLESWIRSKSGKKFAEMLWAKNARIRINLGRI